MYGWERVNPLPTNDVPIRRCLSYGNGNLYGVFNSKALYFSVWLLLLVAASYGW